MCVIYNLMIWFQFWFWFQKVQNIIAELLDSSEPFIHDTYGCGSQGLINLMITGQAVPHVWDHDKDVGGLSKFDEHFYILILNLWIESLTFRA